MRKIITILSVFAALIGAQLAFAPAAYAGLFDNAKQEACGGAQLTGGATNCNNADTSEIDKVIQTVVNILSIIVGIVAVIVIIVSGMKMAASGGDTNKVSSAKNGVLFAIVGLIIVALAQIIVKFVLTRIK